MTAQVLDKRIINLMAVPQEKRDLEWLKNSLQSAIELELSTMPPYLCAWWSIKDSDQGTDTANLIRSIIIEEMLHMGLVCNMLTGIGGTPKITVPVYPGHLPGGVRPQLEVYLAGLSKDYLRDVCMQIEYPESGPINSYLNKTYPTVGAFYDAIKEAFNEIKPELNANKQLTEDFSIGQKLDVLETIEDVNKAINKIKIQGEGTPGSPETMNFENREKLAHYYKFAEIYNGKQLIQIDGKWKYEGPEIPFPDTYPMAKVPAGGWPNPSSAVKELLKTFNKDFQEMLDQLEQAWRNCDEDALGNAVSKMCVLGNPVRDLIKIKLPDGSGNYGPDFYLSRV